ncbi:MAG TPA: hypothetical protein VFJ22_17075 [Dermatophilaceae bacterium]|nr:hypothetical protein [Dermatophilaceae bacterium]
MRADSLLTEPEAVSRLNGNTAYEITYAVFRPSARSDVPSPPPSAAG